MVCNVIVWAMAGFFGLAAISCLGLLVVSFVQDDGSNFLLPMITGFLGGSILVWFYNSIEACHTTTNNLDPLK